MNTSGKTLVVIGGGAAGFFCAINAAAINPELRVVIVEKSVKLLSKVKVSGGGRCNVTHACFDIDELIKYYPRGRNFLKKAFHQFSTADTVEWFHQRGVQLKTEADGRMFPVTNDSATIISCLLKEASVKKVEIMMNATVEQIGRREEDGFDLRFADGKTMHAHYLCIATGGFAKESQFSLIKSLGHPIEPPVPSLFTFNMPKHPICSLMGVSINPASVKVAGTKLQQSGPVLITHWGLSGPAVLKLSAWGARQLAEANYDFKVHVNWLNNVSHNELKETWEQLRSIHAQQNIGNRNPFNLPSRFWAYLLEECQVPETTKWSQLPGKLQNMLIKRLTDDEFHVQGKTTFKEEFVTAGGVALSSIDANTMESRIVPNLFFAGEVMDVDGVTGGFNFQNAWTTGFIAASTIASR